MSETVKEVALILLKAVGITVIGQLAAALYKDAGESALAYTVQLASKVCVLAVSLPLLTGLLTLCSELTQ